MKKGVRKKSNLRTIELNANAWISAAVFILAAIVVIDYYDGFPAFIGKSNTPPSGESPDSLLDTAISVNQKIELEDINVLSGSPFIIRLGQTANIGPGAHTMTFTEIIPQPQICGGSDYCNAIVSVNIDATDPRRGSGNFSINIENGNPGIKYFGPITVTFQKFESKLIGGDQAYFATFLVQIDQEKPVEPPSHGKNDTFLWR